MWRPWSICGAGSPVARILGSESQGVVVAGLSLFTLSPGDTLKPWVLGRDVLFYGKNSPRGHSKGTELKLRLLPAHFELLILMRQQTRKKRMAILVGIRNLVIRRGVTASTLRG